MADVWVLDETRPLTTDDALEAASSSLGFEDVERPPLAAVLHDVTIHDNKRLFGPGEVRLDWLFASAASEEQIYQPGTFTFPGVRNHGDLPIDENGMLLYFGAPRYFLDMSIIASKGGSDKTLEELLAENADQLANVLGKLAVLTAAAPQAAAITGAAAAAAKLAAAALRLLDDVTGKSIGLYRVTWFEHRDRFGLGDHPNDGDRFRKGDFEFRYEIFEDKARS